MIKLDIRAFISVMLIIFFAACTGSEEIKNMGIGISIKTEKGLVQITRYEEEHDDWDIYFIVTPGSKVSPSAIKAIYINIPEANISNTKLYFLDAYKVRFYPNSSEPLSINIEKMKNGVYKIVCNELKNKRDPGYLLLYVSMPLGIGDRLYEISF